MTTEQIDSDKINVYITIRDTGQQLGAALTPRAIRHSLDTLVDITPGRMPAVRGTDLGVAVARGVFKMLLEGGEKYPIMTFVPALWICLYNTPDLPGVRQLIDELDDAAGNGVLEIDVSNNLTVWEYTLTYKGGVEHGRATVRPMEKPQ